MRRSSTERARSRHPHLGVRSAVRASYSPTWIMVAAWISFAVTVFFLRLAGVGYEGMALAFPPFCLTYLWFAKRFVVVQGGNGIHLVAASRVRYTPREVVETVAIEDIDLIETAMRTDRWAFGDRDLAIAKKDRQKVIEMIGLVAAR